jgi:hypothetical protein
MLPGILVVLVYFTIIFIEVFELPWAICTTAEIPVLVVTDGLERFPVEFATILLSERVFKKLAIENDGGLPLAAWHPENRTRPT